jgi:hypothetical protein
MAITDINISETLEAGAPSIKYTGNMDPNIQMASHEGNDAWLERRFEELLELGLSPEAAAAQAQKELREGNVPEPYATGGRAHFGLGSIIKKITKPIKKLVKSPIGKAAVLGGLGAYGMGWGPFGKLGGSGFLKGIGPALFGANYGDLGIYGPARSGITPGILGKLGLTKGGGSMMPTALGWGATALAGTMGATAFEGMSDEQITELKNNPEALRAHLTQYYRNVNPDKSDEEVSTWVETQMYSTGGRVGLWTGTLPPKRKDPAGEAIQQKLLMINKRHDDLSAYIDSMAQGENTDKLRKELDQETKDAIAKAKGTPTFSQGGRIGLKSGTSKKKKKLDQGDILGNRFAKKFKEYALSKEAQLHAKDYDEGIDRGERRAANEVFQEAGLPTMNKGGRIGYAEGNDDKEGIIELEMSIADRWEKIKELMKKMEEIKSGKTTAPDKKAKGGRIGFAYGPDQTAQAAGILEGLPLRKNSAGVKELDLRDSGGFIPPVGVKEKADDIPAMLSNNEFVFTADAVRAAGGGSVEKGAQVMYDTMKNLESKVV